MPSNIRYGRRKWTRRRTDLRWGGDTPALIRSIGWQLLCGCRGSGLTVFFREHLLLLKGLGGATQPVVVPILGGIGCQAVKPDPLLSISRFFAFLLNSRL